MDSGTYFQPFLLLLYSLRYFLYCSLWDLFLLKFWKFPLCFSRLFFKGYWSYLKSAQYPLWQDFLKLYLQLQVLGLKIQIHLYSVLRIHMCLFKSPVPPDGEPCLPCPDEENSPPYLSGHRPMYYRFAPHFHLREVKVSKGKCRFSRLLFHYFEPLYQSRMSPGYF